MTNACVCFSLYRSGWCLLLLPWPSFPSCWPWLSGTASTLCCSIERCWSGHGRTVLPVWAERSAPITMSSRMPLLETLRASWTPSMPGAARWSSSATLGLKKVRRCFTSCKTLFCLQARFFFFFTCVSVRREDPGPAADGAEPSDSAGAGCPLRVQHRADRPGSASRCQALQRRDGPEECCHRWENHPSGRVRRWHSEGAENLLNPLLNLGYSISYIGYGKIPETFLLCVRQVELIVNPSDEVIPKLQSEYGLERLDFVFMDHWKKCYAPDLQVTRINH